MADGLNRIEDASRRFAMHHGDMRNAWILLQGFGNHLRIRSHIFGGPQHHMIDTEAFQHGNHALPVGTIGENQHLALPEGQPWKKPTRPRKCHCLAEGCIQTQRLDSLRQIEDLFADRLNLGIELKVPGPGIAQHCLLDIQTRRQWSGVKSVLSLAEGIMSCLL